jgi:cytochrome P450
VGGTGTLAEAIIWVMAELINHPNVFQKLREEIRSVVGSTRLVEESDVASLPYLQAVVKETLRLYPPLPVTTRECRQSCQIGGFDIPKKTAVAINLYAIMRDPELWDNPNEFLPERFLISDTQHKNMEHHGVGNKIHRSLLNYCMFQIFIIIVLYANRSKYRGRKFI